MAESNGRMDFWWDAQERRYVEGTRTGPVHRGTKMSEIPEFEGYLTAKKKLEDVGSRFQHLADLQDYLSDGLVAVQNSLARYANDSDVQRKNKLEGAIFLLRVYQEQLANYDGQKWEFNKMLDANVPTRMTLDAIKADRIATAAIEKAKAIEAQTGSTQKLLGQGTPDAEDEGKDGTPAGS